MPPADRRRKAKGAAATPPAALPRHVAVGPHRYRIVLDAAGLLTAGELSGYTDTATLVIGLAGGQAPSQLAESLLHELTHAVLDGAGLGVELEERIAGTVGRELLAILRANPAVVRFLLTAR